MKQLQRLDEPREMAFFRRFSKLEVAYVESVYGPLGLLETKLRIPSSAFKPFWGLNPSSSPTTTLTLLQGEAVLRAIEAKESRDRALARRQARLGDARASTAWDDLSQEEKELLLLSNAEFRKRNPNVIAAGDGGE